MMGFEETSQLGGVHRVKSEMNGRYGEYGMEYEQSMSDGYGNDYNADVQNLDAQYNHPGESSYVNGDSHSQLYMDAERMAQLEREFHEQVVRLTNARPELEVVINNQSESESIPNNGLDITTNGMPSAPTNDSFYYAENLLVDNGHLTQEPSPSSNKPFPCPICGKTFGRLSHVRRHQLLHTGDKPFQCNVCGERFTRIENRDRHMTIHTKSRPYNCSVCQKGFTQLNRLKVHMLIHTGDRPFACTICDKAFMRLDHLKVHLKMHEKHAEEGPAWNRKIRKTSFDQQPDSPATTSPDIVTIKAEPVDPDTLLLEHQQAAYTNNDTTSNYLDVQKKQYQSQSLAYKQPQAAPNNSEVPVKRYQRTGYATPAMQPTYIEGQEKPFQCPMCPKTFARRDHYNRHVLVHSGAKPHECDVCGRSFSRKDNKYSHMANCILKNFGISIEQDQRGTLESAVEAKMLEISGLVLPRHKFDYDSKQAELTEEQIENIDQPTNAMLPLSVEASQSGDADEQSIPSPESVGTLRLRALDELSKSGPQFTMPSFNETNPSEQNVDEDEIDDDDDDDFVDPSEFLSADLNDMPAKGETSFDVTLANTERPPRQFQCQVCQRQFAHKSHLVRHSMMHTGEKPFKCDQCDKSFNRKEHLQRHVIVHTGIKPYKCNVCDRSFYHLHQQMRHTIEDHGEDGLKGTSMDGSGAFMDSGEPVQAADGLYHCDRCDKGFSIKFHLKRHYIKHTGEKPFQCDVCDQRFTRSEYKRRHMAIHTNERRFECEFCERRFMRADHMLAHIKTHEGILPYKCNVCGQRFGTSKEKIKHSRKHTGAYRCEMCLERFELFADLAEHRREIHLQNDTEKSEILVGRHEHYPCPICKKYFNIVALGDHLKTHVIDDASDSGRVTNSSERNDGDSLESNSFGCTDEEGGTETATEFTMVKEEMIDYSDAYISSF